MFICQGYLHSAISPTMELTLSRGADAKIGQLKISSESHRPAKSLARKIVHNFSKASISCGILPITSVIDADIPGRGNHIGGTFPMSKHPKPFESDTLGRPECLNRVHVVDASVLPSIPATTITFGVMVNAHRIAKETCKL